MKDTGLQFGSVCSGIEAASVAWEPMGWQASWLAEIEAFPSALLAHHYPTVPNLGDMTKIAELVTLGLVTAPDLLVGGTPCQAFSVAGLRKSLTDERGQLTLSFIGLANAIDERRKQRNEPECVITWENVPGVLNTPDNAFGCFLAGLAGEDFPLKPSGARWTNAGCVYGPQRAVAWRVLDAQYFGVAQRRRRVFVVASARTGFDPSEVLFEFDGLRRDIAPSREARQSPPAFTATSFGNFREGVGTLRANGGDVGGGSETLTFAMSSLGGSETLISPTLDCRASNGPMQSQTALGIVTANRMAAFGEYVDDGTASTMKARDYKDATDLVAYGIQANIIGRQDHNGGNGVGVASEIAPTLTGADRHGVCSMTPFEVAGSMLSRSTSEGFSSSIDHAAGGYMCLSTEVTPTLTSNGDAHSGFRDEHGLVACFKGGQGSAAGGIGYSEHVSPTLSAADSGSNRTPVLLQSSQVRRLTPRECERLQGFPDGYTLIPVKGKPAADGPRYKALGNSMAVPVMRWIGKRINVYLEAKR